MTVTTFTSGQSAQGLTITNNNTDIVYFLGSSLAGNAVVVNNSGGSTYFYDVANGGTAQIDDNGGTTYFSDNAFADHATISNRNSGFVDFRHTSSAGSATINNGVGGTAFFEDNSTAGSATINNTVGATYFQNASTAAESSISNTGTGFVDFRSVSTAGTATILNDASALAAGTTGSYTDFENDSTAGDSTITSVNGGRVVFYDHSTGGNATLITNGATSSVEFSLTSGPNGDHKLSAGSISGSGTIYLGVNALSVGGLGLDDSVSGAILDGGRGGGTGASLIKEGTGTLTLSGNNTYSGGTTLVGGTLDLASRAAAGSGAVTFTSGAQTLRIEQAALDSGRTLANAIAGFAADGDVIDLRGIGTTAEVSFDYLTGMLIFTNAAHATLATVHLTGSYAGYAFTASSDGIDGTTVTASVPAAILTAGLAHDTAPTPAPAGSTTDGLTSDPTLTGQTNAGATLTFTEGAITLGSLTTADGNYSFGFNGSGMPALADGTHTITVTETFLGHVAKTTSVTLTLDGVAPGAPALALANDTGSSGTDSLTGDASLKVTPAESGGSFAYLIDGKAVAAYDPTALGQGAHTVAVTQTDDAGNVSAASSLSFTLDSVAPGAPTLALANDTGSSGTDGLTGDASLKVTPAEAGGSLAYLVDGKAVAAYDPTTLGQGAHTVAVTQTDNAGNVSEAGSLTFTLDSVAPGAPTLALANDTGSSGTDGLTGDASLKVTPAEAGGSLAYLVDGKAVAAYDPTALGQGAHTVAVTQTDNAGNVSAAGSLSFTLDGVAPGAPALALANDTGSSGTDGMTGDASLEVTPAETGGSLAYLVDGKAVAAYDPTALGQGAHTVAVTQTDDAGNVSAASSLSFILDTLAPTFADPSVSGATNLVGTHVLSGTIDAGDAGAAITIRDGTTVLGTTVADGQGHFSLALLLDGDGPNLAYAFTASATDSAGNSGTSDSFAFKLDFAGNQPLFGAITHDADSPGGQAFALYDGLLGRVAEPTGLEAWASQLAHGTSLHDVAAAFLGSDEFTAAYGGAYTGGSDDAFVQYLYQEALGRGPDAQGEAYWAGLLASGTSRIDVAVSFALSPENQAQIATALQGGVFVPDTDASNIARLYHGLLDRAPDAAGLQYWEGLAHAGTPLTTIAASVLASAEYAGLHPAVQTDLAYIGDLYAEALGRPVDTAGEAHWTGLLAQGATRADVAVGIVESPEAQMHLAGQIEAGWHLS